eukprot:c32247_g1_i1.p1 GENE.c32247_g1_i1~~c32247_g1_i1.p1  ORF type:complete len:151 (+),score=22.99 c32247_g1_i1:32-454(+)
MTWKAPWYNCFAPGIVNCLYACCFSPCALADVSKAAGIQEDWIFDCCCLSLPVLRNQYRKKAGRDGHCSADCCLGGFCPLCALTQMMADQGSSFKILNITGPELKRSFFGGVTAAKAEANSTKAKVQAARGATASIEMIR